MELNHQEFLDRIVQVLGKDQVVLSPADIEILSRDTVPDRVQPLAFVYPASSKEVAEIVRLAVQYRVAVWPHSAGRNWGWSNSPLNSGSVVMILERMNRILQVNEELAYAVIEPGVTYESLNNYLKEHKIKLWSDCTGGPPKGSVLGNALDRGVGVTVHGEHFASLCGLEILLASGETIRTGGYPNGKEGTRFTYKWGTGPYVEGLFSQANFGIVTQAGIWLMPEPEVHLMFGFTIADERQLPALLNKLRKLALDGVIPDKIRVTNNFAVLTLVTQWIKEKTKDSGPYTTEDFKRLDQKYGFGAWSFCSSIYGPRELTAAMRKVVLRELRPFGRVLFFDDAKVKFIEGKVVPLLVWLNKRGRSVTNVVSNSIVKLSLPMIRLIAPLYGVYKGIPTEQIVRRAYFRSKTDRPDKDIHVARDQIGLMWFGPLMPLEGQTVFEVIDQYRSKFHARGFDCYITILMLNSRTVVPLMGIIYRQEEPQERENAVLLYNELMEDSLSRGYQQFRCNRLGWDLIFKYSPEMLAFNEKIKEAIDPHHTLAPGKYGIP